MDHINHTEPVTASDHDQLSDTLTAFLYPDGPNTEPHLNDRLQPISITFDLQSTVDYGAWLIHQHAVTALHLNGTTLHTVNLMSTMAAWWLYIQHHQETSIARLTPDDTPILTYMVRHCLPVIMAYAASHFLGPNPEEIDWHEATPQQLGALWGSIYAMTARAFLWAGVQSAFNMVAHLEKAAGD